MSKELIKNCEDGLPTIVYGPDYSAFDGIPRSSYNMWLGNLSTHNGNCKLIQGTEKPTVESIVDAIAFLIFIISIPAILAIVWG